MKTFCLLIFSIWAVVGAASQLPFSETFDGLNEGALDGQGGWVVSSNGVASVQSSDVYAGRSLKLSGASSMHELSTAESLVWLTFRVKLDGFPAENPGTPDNTASIAFYVNTNGSLVVYSNAVPVTLSTVISSNEWHRFDAFCDYEDMTWSLSVNQTNVCAGLPLFSLNQQVESMVFENRSGGNVFVDEVSVVDVEPTAQVMDVDDDGIPDWWEQKHYGTITAANPNAPASNGVYTTKEAYIAGLNPFGTNRVAIAKGSQPGVLRWEAQRGRKYSIYSTTNLLAGFTLLTSDIPTDSSEFTDVINTNQPSIFYQLRVGL